MSKNHTNDGNFAISKLIRLVIGDDEERRADVEARLGFWNPEEATENLDRALADGICSERLEKFLPFALNMSASVVNYALKRTEEQRILEEEKRKYQATYGKPENFTPMLLVLHPTLTEEHR